MEPNTPQVALKVLGDGEDWVCTGFSALSAFLAASMVV
jgi:hypothetical protein